MIHKKRTYNILVIFKVEDDKQKSSPSPTCKTCLNVFCMILSIRIHSIPLYLSGEEPIWARKDCLFCLNVRKKNTSKIENSGPRGITAKYYYFLT